MINLQINQTLNQCTTCKDLIMTISNDGDKEFIKENITALQEIEG